MTVVLALALGFAICLPHTLRLRDAPPMVAATIWLSTLALRALAAVFAAMFVVLYLPGTELFGLVTHWCWHAVVPFFATHLGLSGHAIGDAATVAPAFVLAISFISALRALWRAGRAVGRLVRRTHVGNGPAGSLIIGGSEVFVAAAGLAHPRVVVSAGALTALDDEELAVSLAHERGHIARRHRYLMVLAAVCRAVGRFVPGAGAAAGAFAYHLERDADNYAIARCHDPLALASAICKAAGAASLEPAAMALGGGDGLPSRLAILTSEASAPSTTRNRLHRGVAVLMTTMVLALLALLPAVATAGVEQLTSSAAITHCPE